MDASYDDSTWVLTSYLAANAIVLPISGWLAEVIGRKRYSHIVDPRTGWALTDRVEVTLIAPNGLTSDPLTKTFCVLGEERADKLAKAYPGVKAYVRVLGAP